ncbi:MAG: sigma-54 interaction domain-containing protein [Bacteroidia bacterium]
MNIQQVKQQFRIIGNNRQLNNAVEVAMLVAPTEVSVLINGANGTGKDVFSRIIHQFSKRKHQPFIAINCGAIPEGTMDSELFGHEKGSFTSAYESRKGYFEEVENGTIFLDEIAEMPLATQARLLRLLENGEYLRVGSSKIRKANIRIIAATNKNLVEMIHKGKFREDLYFRLNTVSISVPALMERGEDIELLFNYFALEFSDKYGRDPIELMESASPMLYKYRWPGNVREMRNLVEKLTVLVRGNYITPEILQANLLIQDSYLPSLVRIAQMNGGDEEMGGNPKEWEMLYKLVYELKKEVTELKKAVFGRNAGLPTPIINSQLIENEVEDLLDYQTELRPIAALPSREPYYPSAEILTPQVNTVVKNAQALEESLSLEKKEKEMIIRALRKHHDNRKKAATELGISERTLYRKIKTYGIEL